MRALVDFVFHLAVVVGSLRQSSQAASRCGYGACGGARVGGQDLVMASSALGHVQ